MLSVQWGLAWHIVYFTKMWFINCIVLDCSGIKQYIDLTGDYRPEPSICTVRGMKMWLKCNYAKISWLSMNLCCWPDSLVCLVGFHLIFNSIWRYKYKRGWWCEEPWKNNSVCHMINTRLYKILFSSSLAPRLFLSGESLGMRLVF